MKRQRAVRLAAALVLAAGSATAQTASVAALPADPWERLNRSLFAFNEMVDDAIGVPVATLYQAVLPGVVRTGVSNVFSNVLDGWSAVNHLLQGKPEGSVAMTMRFLTNTTFGFAGLFDIATEAGIERQPEDFGQTLGRWGFGAGPYLVLPIFGPSSLRDAVALPVDYAAAAAILHVDGGTRTSLTVLELVDSRSKLLAARRLLDQVALDKYSFIRDAYLARRRSMVFDGNPPEEPPEPDDPPQERKP